MSSKPRRFPEIGLWLMAASVVLVAVGARTLAHFIAFASFGMVGLLVHLLERTRRGPSRRARERDLEIKAEVARRRRKLAN